MKRVITILTIVLFSFILISGCTQMERAKSFGGTITVDLEKGQKLINVTWKQSRSDMGLWCLTRPMKAGEEAETYTFKETSQFGIFEGTVIIKEHK